MFIELHLIQSFAPANLNRDDTGNPKDCEFGGHRRARVSSQCIKRAIRLHPVFHNNVKVDIGQRTKWLTRPIIKGLTDAKKSEEDATIVARAFAAHYSSKDAKKDGAIAKMDKEKPDKTPVLLYLSSQEIERLVSAILENWEAVLAEASADAKGATIPSLIKSHIIVPTKGRTSAPDIALFGRMLADQPELKLDAACQVAHALSTHRVTMEMDYYTAVDDLPQDDEVGAGMVGFTGYNSACFYRYARIDWQQLVKNLNDDQALARRTVEAFLRAAHAAVPSGKQNAFAAQNPPSFSLSVVRDDGMAWSLANAFETPVRAGRESGYVVPSIRALDEYWGRLQRVYGSNGVTAAALQLEDGIELAHLKNDVRPHLDSWVAATVRALPKE